MLGIIQDDPSNENILLAIKRMKGEKKIISCLKKNKYKDLIKQSDNLVRMYAFQQLVFNNDKNGSKTTTKRSKMLHKGTSRHDTKVIVRVI